MFESIKAWARRHKRGIIITCVIVSVVGTVAVLIINGKKVTIPVKELADKIVPDIPKTAKPIETAEGWHASAEKLAQAAAMGIDLKPGETIVNACMVTKRAA